MNEPAADGKQICVSFYVEWRFIFMELKLQRANPSWQLFLSVFLRSCFCRVGYKFCHVGSHMGWNFFWLKMKKNWKKVKLSKFSTQQVGQTVTHPISHLMFAQNILGRSTNWIFVPLLCSRAEPSTCWIESTKAQTGQQNNIKKGINHAFLCLCHWMRVRGRVECCLIK